MASSLALGCAQARQTVVSRLWESPKAALGRATGKISRLIEPDSLKSERYAKQGDRRQRRSAQTARTADSAKPPHRTRIAALKRTGQPSRSKDDRGEKGSRQRGNEFDPFANNWSRRAPLAEDPFLNSPPTEENDESGTMAEDNPTNQASYAESSVPETETSGSAEVAKHSTARAEHAPPKNNEAQRFDDDFEAKLARLRAAMNDEELPSLSSFRQPPVDSDDEVASAPPFPAPKDELSTAEPSVDRPVPPPLDAQPPPVKPSFPANQLSQAGPNPTRSRVEILPPPPSLQEPKQASFQGGSPSLADATAPGQETSKVHRPVRDEAVESDSPEVPAAEIAIRPRNYELSGEAQKGMIVESDLVPWRSERETHGRIR